MINIKKKLFLDMDGCITNSVKKICDIYNFIYKDYEKFEPARDYMVNTWDFSDECKLAKKEEINDYFNREEFFDENLEFMENAEEIIYKLSERFDIYIVSMGNKPNLKYKKQWLNEKLPYIKGFIGCDFEEVSDKSSVNMEGSIFIDDSANNLETSNAEILVCYGDIFEWNKNYKGKRCWNWYEVEKYLMNLQV